MAKTKIQKQTSPFPLYISIVLIVALVITGAVVYLWVKNYSPASEASSTTDYVDHTGTMHFNGQKNTLVLGTLKPYLKDVEYGGDPVINTENKIKEIQALVLQANNLIAAVTGGTTTTPALNESYDASIDDELDLDLPTDSEFPIDSFVPEDTSRDTETEDAVVDTEDKVELDQELDESLEIKVPEIPTTWLGRTTSAIKSFLGKAADTAKSWFRGEKTPSPVKPEASQPPKTEASLSSFKAQNFANYAKLVVVGENLKTTTAGNLAPEKGSKLTVLFSDGTKTEFGDTKFMVANEQITLYIYEKFKKISQVHFQSPTLGSLYAFTGTTITQPASNKPKLTSYKVERYGVYDQLALEGENLVVDTNRAKSEEQIITIDRNSNVTIYNSRQFYGSKTKVIIIGEVGEFDNLINVKFESPSRGVSDTGNQLSLINIINSFIGKALASIPQTNSQTPLHVSSISSHARQAQNRQAAYDDLKEEIDDVIDKLAIHEEAINNYINSNNQSFIDDTSQSGLTIKPESSVVDNQISLSLPSSAVALKRQLVNARSSLSALKLNDPMLKIWERAVDFEGMFPLDFDIRYSTGGTIFAVLHGSDAEVASAINTITNDQTALHALSEIGRTLTHQYDASAWIEAAQKTAKNVGGTVFTAPGATELPQ